MKLTLKFKHFDRFDHPTFSTHLTVDWRKTQKKLVKIAKSLDDVKFKPIWISEEHGTCFLTVRNRNLKKLIVGGVYELDLEFRRITKDGETFANCFCTNHKLISKPDLGELITFDESDSDDDDEDDEA
jgi:hypothetical protein